MKHQATLAIVTIGQSPRVDLHDDLAELLGTDIIIKEYGALDGLSLPTIQQRYPIEGKSEILVSRMKDGQQVQISEQDLEPLLISAVEQALDDKPDLVVVLCTGDLPEFPNSSVPVLSPKRIVEHFFKGIQTSIQLIVMSPDKAQVENTQRRWKDNGFAVTCISGSPYKEDGERERAAQQARDLPGNMIYLDCMGYQLGQREAIAHISQKAVITPRQIIFNAVRLLLNSQ